MQLPDKLSNEFSNSKFAFEHINIIAPIISSHFDIYLKLLEKDSAENIDFSQIGTPNEIKLKKVSHYYGLISTVIEDLERVLIFLRFKDRNILLSIFPGLSEEKEYYKYHFENYMIRVNTISDLVGKLGNILYNTGLGDKCNGYNFKEKIKPTNLKSAKLVENLLKITFEIKQKRHKKIHKGETDISNLSGVVFWNDILKISNKKASESLEELTDESLNNKIDELEMEIIDIIKAVNQFLDNSVNELIKLAN